MTTLRQQLDAKTEAYATLLAKIEDVREIFENVIARSLTNNNGNAWADDHYRLQGMFNAHFPPTSEAAISSADTGKTP